MSLIGLRLASRHPEFWVGAKKYIKLYDVAGLRFELRSFISPTAIRVKINNKAVVENTIYINNDANIIDREYINLWFRAPILDNPEARLVIELCFFGFFIKAMTLDIYCSASNSSESHLSSDAIIDLNKICANDLQNSELIKTIENFPSVVRSMKSNSLRKSVKSILILRLDQLGDFILTVPAIVRLKTIFPDAEITALVSPANVDCARSINLFSRIIEVPFSFQKGTNKRFLSDAAKETVEVSTISQNFDLAIDLSVMPESRQLLALINSDYKVGFENTNSYMMDLGILLHAKDPANLLSNVSHATYPMLIVEATRLALCPEYSHIPLNKNYISRLDVYKLTPSKYTVIHSGSRNILARWPQNRFIELAIQIASLGEAVVFFSDDVVPQEFKDSLQKSDIQIFEGGMNFDHFDAIISFARVYIGNDTGPKHLAALRNVPVISIHSARSNWSEWGQVDSGYTISRRVPCAGCGIETKRECGRGLTCLNNITVQEVFDCYRNI